MTGAARLGMVGQFLDKLRGGSVQVPGFGRVGKRYRRHYERLREVPTGEHHIDKFYKPGQNLLDRDAATAAAAAGTAGAGAAAGGLFDSSPISPEELKKIEDFAVDDFKGGAVGVPSGGRSTFKDYWGKIDVATVAKENPAVLRENFAHAEGELEKLTAEGKKPTERQINKRARIEQARQDPDEVGRYQKNQDLVRTMLKNDYGIDVPEGKGFGSRKDLEDQIKIKYSLGDKDSMGELEPEVLKKWHRDWSVIQKANKAHATFKTAGTTVGAPAERRGELTEQDIRKGRTSTMDFTPPKYDKGRHVGTTSRPGSPLYEAALTKHGEATAPAKFIQGPPPPKEKPKPFESPKPTDNELRGAVGWLKSEEGGSVNLTKIANEKERKRELTRGIKGYQSLVKQAKARNAHLFEARIRQIAFEKGKKDRTAIYVGAGVGGVGGTAWAHKRHKDVTIRDRILKKRGMTPRSRVKLNVALHGGSLLRILGGAGAGALAGYGYKRLRDKKGK